MSFDSDLVLDAHPTEGWDARPVSKISQSIGDRWVRESKKPILRVPSAVVPNGSNYLLNFNHPDFDQIKISEPLPLDFHPRFKK
ncbi:MAG: RES family NAD+ phosphorylase [Desulfobacula sp.]|nr:RES family NAD+ phosphorylase [Desulfobacula sp.]